MHSHRQALAGTSPPLIVAHRGARRDAPENSKSAFDAALRSGVDGIELDVQLTKDGVPVLYHNRTLARITGRRMRVRDYTEAEMARVDFGAWFSDSFRGEPLLTLEHALRRYSGQTRLFIELKSREVDRRSGTWVELTHTAINMIRAIVAPDRIPSLAILSFDPQVLRLSASLEPDWHYILNAKNSGAAACFPSTLMSVRPGVCIPYRFLDEHIAGTVRVDGRQLATYTCNSPARLRRAMRFSADIIMTDDPARIVPVARVFGDEAAGYVD